METIKHHYQAACARLSLHRRLSRYCWTLFTLGAVLYWLQQSSPLNATLLFNLLQHPVWLLTLASALLLAVAESGVRWRAAQALRAARHRYATVLWQMLAIARELGDEGGIRSAEAELGTLSGYRRESVWAM